MHRRSLVVCLAVLTAASCSRKPAPSPLGIDAQLAAMTPREATVLAGFRMDRIRSSPLYEEYFRGRLPGAGDAAGELMRFQEQVDELLVAVSGRETLVLARGRFDRAAVERKLRDSGAAETSVAAHKAFGGSNALFVPLDGGYALAGPRTLVEDALGRAGHTVALPARFFKPAQEIPAASHAWVISVGQLPPLAIPERSNLANLPRALERVELATASADLGNGMKLHAAATCTTEDDARQIQTLLRGVIGMARLSAPADQRELRAAFDRIQVAQSERTVTLSANLPADLVDLLAGALGVRRGETGR